MEVRAAAAVTNIRSVPEVSMKTAKALEAVLAAKWQTLEQAAFGLFMGSLIALLIVTYAGLPVVGGP